MCLLVSLMEASGIDLIEVQAIERLIAYQEVRTGPASL